ncbi:pLS20_p028 family conjugation system transmembrane protein [Virgibacillus salexigens]|uniref:DUF8208 domain-containing protein n=1 Tax=Virgibacillus massiliensis TaxID=1462526 RepID=A0A024QH37_9BACI|nr:hypothetical protein [Virgibacillus massiliensis]CDQ41537.1 hypothetical protein BN990_03910 [Virgibacillus massiliensis]
MDENVVGILEKFSDHLEIANPLVHMLRVIGWMIIKGLAWVVDGLENVTNRILGLKLFYEHPEFVDFIESFQPVLVILFAFNILFIGYLLIFQRKFNREGVLTNIIMALIIVVLLGSGMQQVDRFSTRAINAIDVGEDDTVSSKVIKDNMTDVAQFDSNGWKTPELENPNKIPQDNVPNINITETIDANFQFDGHNERVSKVGRDVLTHKLTYSDSGTSKLTELDTGWFTIDEYYYRWSWDFWHMFFRLGIMAVVLVTISVKLAQLFFELAFNQALATFIAPLDMHSGQKMKQVVQSILSIFIVMIMIFLSMKIYLIGSDWIGEFFDGAVYLVAMLGFARAVIDGPNIVERLFGIDAGVKSGWSAIAGTYAFGKSVSSVTKGLGQGAKNVAKGASKLGGEVADKGLKTGGFASGMAQEMLSKQKKGNNPLSQSDNQTNDNKNPNFNENNQQQMAPNELEDMNEFTSSYEGNQSSNLQSSLQDEMNKKSEKGNQNKSDKPQSLHEEMKKKGYANNSNSAMPGENYSSNSNLISSEMLSENEPRNNSDSVEGRHIGQVFKDKTTQTVRNNRMVQNTKRSYQIGKNTGNFIRKNYKKQLKK